MSTIDNSRSLSRRALLRKVAAGAGAAGIGAALAACGMPFGAPATPLPTPEPQTIVLWNWIDNAGDALVRGFQAANPNVRVRLERRGYGQAHALLASSLESGSGAPDVFITDLDNLGRLRELDGLADLADAPFDGAMLKESFIPTLWGYGAYHGGQIAMPWNVGLGLGWYRPDIFAAAGLPTEPDQVQREAETWDGWLALDAALRRAEPKSALISAAGQLFNTRVEQQGHGWVEGDRLLIEEKGVPAAELVAQAIERDVPATANDRQIMRELVDGRLAGMVDGSWMQFFLQQEALQTAGQWRVIRAPGGDYIAGALFLIIPQQSQRKEAAWTFVRYLCATIEGQNATFKATGAFPSYRPAWDDPAYAQPVEFFGGQTAYRLMAEVAANLPDGTISPHDQTIAEIVGREVDNVARQGKDPEQAMADAEAAALAQLPELTR